MEEGKKKAQVPMHVKRPIVLVAVVVFAFLIIAVLFRYKGMRNNESRAINYLKNFKFLEIEWHQEDYDGNGKHEYWTYDISCLVRIPNRDGKIWHPLAAADGAPAERNDAFDKDWWQGSSRDGWIGYFYRAMLKDETGTPYNQNEFKGIKALNEFKFGIVAYPSEYNSTGRLTFIINEKGVIYYKNTKGEPVLEWPAENPQTAGWQLVEEIE
ncbi:MAG: DUF2950 family protein [Planctomycetes bacterium]|nr:DUF2950 family protein [Planctomycetota bacterium]